MREDGPLCGSEAGMSLVAMNGKAWGGVPRGGGVCCEKEGVSWGEKKGLCQTTEKAGVRTGRKREIRKNGEKLAN